MHQGPQEDTNGSNLALWWSPFVHQGHSCHTRMGGHLSGNLLTSLHSVAQLVPAFPGYVPPQSSSSKGRCLGYSHLEQVLTLLHMFHRNPNLHLCFKEMVPKKLILSKFLRHKREGSLQIILNLDIAFYASRKMQLKIAKCFPIFFL